VQLAMQGLMQSPGHRANILSPNFKKAGIGVISAREYMEKCLVRSLRINVNLLLV